MQTWEEWDNQKKKERLNFALGMVLIFIVLVIAFLFLAVKANAEGIPEEVAVHCIMGEARGEGYSGMLAHGEALRARGTIKGVYGCKSKFKEPEWVWDMARKAWKESRHTKTVKGADHWGSLIVDKKWIAEMERKGFVRTAIIKNTAFYKKVVKR